jgi:hypothetical protein
MLTSLEHSITVTTFPMHASIFSSWFSSTEYRDAGPINPREQSSRSATLISLNKALGYVKAFVTLAKSKTLPFHFFFDNLERSRAFLVEYLNPDPLLCFRVSVVGNIPSASIIWSNSWYDLWASTKMSDTLQASLPYICVLCTKVPNSSAYIFGYMILMFTDSFLVDVAAILSNL